MKILIIAKPNSKEERIETNPMGEGFIIYVKESPIQGRANMAVIKILQEYFHTRNIKIISGWTSRNKIIEVG